MSNTSTGVILAGGKSSRMGENKALLNLDGRPFVAHVASTLQAVFDRVVVVANDDSTYGFLGLEIFGDIYHDCGPLGGIHSALVHANNRDIFVSACDTPFITKDLVNYIIAFESRALAKVPSHNNRVHPLCGLYTQDCVTMIVKRLESRRLRVLDFLEEAQATVIPISPELPFFREELFANFNSPADRETGKQ
jgi:molybdopterin-guanine dinucleotide biosynthesis protein A